MHALNALGGSQNQKLEYAKAWMPNDLHRTITWNFTILSPWKSLVEIEKVTFKLISISKYRISYKVYINKHTGSGKVYLSQNYKRVGLLFILAPKLIHQLQK